MKLEEIKERLDSVGLLQLGLPKIMGETPDLMCDGRACLVACEPGDMF